MNEFRIRLANAMTVQGVSCADADNVIDRVMQLVKEAIETPATSPEIDTWLVRTALGKIGTRASETVVEAFVGDDPKVLDRNVEIYARIYDTERRCGATSHEAAERANRVVEGMNRIGAISGKE